MVSINYESAKLVKRACLEEVLQFVDGLAPERATDLKKRLYSTNPPNSRGAQGELFNIELVRRKGLDFRFGVPHMGEGDLIIPFSSIDNVWEITSLGQLSPAEFTPNILVQKLSEAANKKKKHAHPDSVLSVDCTNLNFAMYHSKSRIYREWMYDSDAASILTPIVNATAYGAVVLTAAYFSEEERRIIVRYQEVKNNTGSKAIGHGVRELLREHFEGSLGEFPDDMVPVRLD